MKEPLSFEKSQPLNAEQAKILIFLVDLEKRQPEKLNVILEGIKDEFLYKVYAKRMEVLKLPLKLSNSALFFLLCLCDRVGHVPVFMIDCLELMKDLSNGFPLDTAPYLSLDDVVTKLYPWGFYKGIAFIDRVDNEIKQGKGEFDYIY
jgi:hypothetical protein